MALKHLRRRKPPVIDEQDDHIHAAADQAIKVATAQGVPVTIVQTAIVHGVDQIGVLIIETIDSR